MERQERSRKLWVYIRKELWTITFNLKQTKHHRKNRSEIINRKENDQGTEVPLQCEEQIKKWWTNQTQEKTFDGMFLWITASVGLPHLRENKARNLPEEDMAKWVEGES